MTDLAAAMDGGVTTVPEAGELGLVPISMRAIDDIRPSPENDELYRPIDETDPEIIALAKSIEKNGLQEPLLVTMDGWIISGHRRYAAAELAGLDTLPCRVAPIYKDDDKDYFLRLLRECNLQRVKTFDEKAREELISANPEEAYDELVAHRCAKSAVRSDQVMTIAGSKSRSVISDAKEPFLKAVKAVIADRKAFWPLSDRQIHYALLNNPPLRHASKSDSQYNNTPASYKSLVDLLTRARVAGFISMDVIADETRPEIVWDVHRDVQGYLRREFDSFLKGYWRDLMQSQPHHIEIVGEKNTIASIINPVSSYYTIPMTIMRGFCSLPPRYHIAERFQRSGKDRLVLLIASDFDPDGEEIAHSLAMSMRDDFGITNVLPIKVALDAQQVQRFNLPPAMEAKESSANYSKFTSKHGANVYELEALKPEDLQLVLHEAIEKVIDMEAFNAEKAQEKQDAAQLAALRQTMRAALVGHTGLGGQQ